MIRILEKGYDGYSMSNNARDAYDDGEKPISKWTKGEILSAVNEIRPDLVDALKSVNAKTLKSKLLTQSSWHHTSSYYNRTNFYSIDEYALDDLKVEDILSWTEVEPSEPTSNTYKGDFEYIEWTGSRKHPKANPQYLKNVNIEERGSFYYVTDDNGRELIKKKIGSNGTYARRY